MKTEVIIALAEKWKASLEPSGDRCVTTSEQEALNTGYRQAVAQCANELLTLVKLLGD